MLARFRKRPLQQGSVRAHVLHRMDHPPRATLVDILIAEYGVLHNYDALRTPSQGLCHSDQVKRCAIHLKAAVKSKRQLAIPQRSKNWSPQQMRSSPYLEPSTA